MINDEQIEKLFQNAEQHDNSGLSDKHWKQLELRMQAKQSSKRLIRYRFISFAASTVAILAVTAFFFYNNHNYNPELIAYSETNAMEMEELLDAGNDLYNLQKLESLQQAYLKMEGNRIK